MPDHHLVVAARPGPARKCPALPGVAGEHVLFSHDLLWRFLPPDLADPWGDDQEHAPFFVDYDERSEPGPLLGAAGLIVLVGAADSPLWRELSARLPGRVLLFEPEPKRFTAFARAVGQRALSESGVRVFLGDVDALDPSLARLLPEGDFAAGYPLVFIEKTEDQALCAYARQVAEAVEVLYFRHVLYQLEGQFSRRSLPLVPIRRGLMFDQLRHAYQNAWSCAHHAGRLDELKNLFPGRTAVLVASGPDLPQRLPRLRELSSRAVIICVNSALRTLLDAGIEPHVVIINDTGVEVEKSLLLANELDNTLLVAHCLASCGRPSFPRVYFFDQFRPEVFGKRQGLPMHGSVITAAFSLARHMGCAKVIFAGLTLASSDPLRMSYGDGRQLAGVPSRPPVLQGRFPELYPTHGLDGQRLYTTLNFLDVKYWLADALRASGLKAVNMGRHSLFHGEGIEYDENPQVEDLGDPRELIAALPLPVPVAVPGTVLAYVRGEIELWESLSASCRELARNLALDAAHLPQAEALLQHFNEHNITFLLQRFPMFDWWMFWRDFYLWGRSDAQSRRLAMIGYLHSACQLMEHFLSLLQRQLVYLERSPQQGGYWPFLHLGPPEPGRP